MPTLVHLADERESSSIKKNGIKPGKGRAGIYCMPVLPDFYVSHQWLRELKRGGARTYAGVYFKLDSKTLVHAAKYNEPHTQMTLGQAIKEIMSLNDPMGYEIIIGCKITAKEITKVKSLPQTTGWRFYPKAKGRKPCGCKYCLAGDIKGRRYINRFNLPEKTIPYAQIIKKMKHAETNDELFKLFDLLQRRIRRSDPAELSFLFERQSESINDSLAMALKYFRHKNTKKILLELLKSPDKDTALSALYSLLHLYPEMEKTLEKNVSKRVRKLLKEWQE